MLPIRFPFFLLFLLAGACKDAAPTPSTPDRESLSSEVRKVMAELVDAMNSHDPEQVLSHYRKSEEFVYVGCTDPMFGSDTHSTLVAPYYRTRSDVTFRQEILRIQVLSPTSAVVTVRGNSSNADALFWTYVLVKEGGKWLIAHEHESWPGCAEPPPLHPTGSPGGSGAGRSIG